MISRVILFAAVAAVADAGWAGGAWSSGNPCYVTPVDGVVTAAQITAALANEADPTKLPDKAFWLCTDLVTVTLPTGITTTGINAFLQATSPTGTVIIPEGVTTIGKFLFRDNHLLTTVIFPASLTRINNNNWSIFNGDCSALTTICGATNPELTVQKLSHLFLDSESPADFDMMTSACSADLYPASSVADDSCSISCTLSDADVILVSHDTTSGHASHRCFHDGTTCSCDCS